MARRLAGLVGLLAAACAAPPEVAHDYDQCRASCARPGADVASCEQWLSSASTACVQRYSALQTCCQMDGRPMCATSRLAAPGAPCVCRASDARGAYAIQGYACRPS